MADIIKKINKDQEIFSLNMNDFSLTFKTKNKHLKSNSLKISNKKQHTKFQNSEKKNTINDFLTELYPEIPLT